MLAADRTIVRIGIGPPGMPIGLPRVGHGVHHEGVDVRNRQAGVGDQLANLVDALRQQPRRPRMRHVGEQLNAAIAEAGHPANGLLKREAEIGVGAKGKFHACG
jgi:hypothetical protein